MKSQFEPKDFILTDDRISRVFKPGVSLFLYLVPDK